MSTCVEDNISGNVDDGVWCGSRSPTYPQQATVATAANDNATISYIARKHGLTAIVLDAISLITSALATEYARVKVECMRQRPRSASCVCAFVPTYVLRVGNRIITFLHRSPIL